MNKVIGIFLVLIAIGCKQKSSAINKPETTVVHTQLSQAIPIQQNRLYCSGLRVENSPPIVMCFSNQNDCNADYARGARFERNGVSYQPCQSVDRIYCFDYLRRYSNRQSTFCSLTETDCQANRNIVRSSADGITNCESRNTPN